jgi:tetratricopeptide (TPR) repeat protein
MKPFLCRLMAGIAVAAGVLGALELGLRLAGYGETPRFLIPDPDRPGYLRTNPRYVGSLVPVGVDLPPRDAWVSADKAPGTLRVVVLGESAAEGIPFPAFGLAASLRAQLRARYPGRNIEVINTGIVAINSHVVAAIARELAGYQPDLFVAYLGNNEVVGPYGPGSAFLPEVQPLWIIRASLAARSSRIGQLVAAVVGRLTGRRPVRGEWKGMAAFVDHAVAGDDPRLAGVYCNFEGNLRDIVRSARRAGARTILCTPVSNLKDCAPFLSLHRGGLSPADLERWTAAFERGRVAWLLGDAARARAALEEAGRLDAHYADTAFMLGDLDLREGRTDAARAHFVEAEHWDGLRFRPDPAIASAIRRVAGTSGPEVVLADAARLLGSDPAAGGPIAGRELLFEHVHLDWPGSFQVGLLLAQAAEKALGGAGPGPWLDERACAAALGCGPEERLPVLEAIGPILQNPPFTQQLTYPEDQARFVRDFAEASHLRADRPRLEAHRQKLAGERERDDLNADLAELLKGVDDSLGNLPAALEDARRVRALRPSGVSTQAAEAVELLRLRRLPEAAALLEEAAAQACTADRAKLAPALADLHYQTGQSRVGLDRLRSLASEAPDPGPVRLTLAEFLERTGDRPGAEAELRSLLEADHGDRNALNRLEALLDGEGRSAEADALSVEAVGYQPRNAPNDLRAAGVLSSRRDDAGEGRALEVAERAGPVGSADALQLARKLFRLGRPNEGLAQLAFARRISLYEGDPAAAARISEIIAGVTARPP